MHILHERILRESRYSSIHSVYRGKKRSMSLRAMLLKTTNVYRASSCSICRSRNQGIPRMDCLAFEAS